MPVDHISIYGPHNLSNALAACGLASIIGLSSKSIREAISIFKGLPHRCEKFLTVKNIDFINDSKSTNIDSTRVAIEAFRSDQTKNIILLMGGIDKNQNFSILNSIIGSAVKRLVLFGRHAERIKKMIDRSFPSEIFGFLEEATTYAYQIADSGDKILFSPGCSSFDEFANFEERGTYFKELILRHGSKYEK
jgi:UDP-N-acetylmuramoylalanine--D-glutamate ligase